MTSSYEDLPVSLLESQISYDKYPVDFSFICSSIECHLLLIIMHKLYFSLLSSTNSVNIAPGFYIHVLWVIIGFYIMFIYPFSTTLAPWDNYSELKHI
jgi:hypothetical protein